MSLQRELNDKKTGDCLFENGKLIPCGYHWDRALNSAYGIKETITTKRENFESGIIHSSGEFKTLARKFQSSQKPPAGGWYLVKEQRDWLRDNLVKEFNNYNDGATIRILEAGVAGYIHHYTYLTILQEALGQLSKSICLEVVVVDKCLYPLEVIETINNSNPEQLKKIIELPGHHLTLDDDVIRLLDTYHLVNCEHFIVKTMQIDLTDRKKIAQLDSFDIVTEHFITAVVENFDSIKLIRENYSVLLNDGGCLLCASGITRGRNKEMYYHFLDMHEHNGLYLQEEMLVWDPYGMSRDDILLLLKDDSIPAYFDNSLFKFQKSIARGPF